MCVFVLLACFLGSGLFFLVCCFMLFVVVCVCSVRVRFDFAVRCVASICVFVGLFDLYELCV